jgi:agmatinase
MPRPNFLNLSDDDASLARARYVLLPVPYDRTVTYKKGAAKAPQAILEASTQLELWDEETGLEAWKEGIHTADPLTTTAPPDVLAGLTEPRARALLAPNEAGTPRVLGVLGGEHSISLGPVRAVASVHPDLAILHVDAHADVRAGFGGTEFGHGCIFRKIVEHAPVVQVGIRSASPGEAEYLAQEPRIRTFWAHQLRRDPSRAAWIAKVMEALGPAGRPVYLSIDVDGLDPGILPGTGTPEPGGLSWADLVEMIQAAAQRFEIVAFDVVEVLPEKDRILSEFVAARLVYKIVSFVEAARRTKAARAAARAEATRA